MGEAIPPLVINIQLVLKPYTIEERREIDPEPEAPEEEIWDCGICMHGIESRFSVGRDADRDYYTIPINTDPAVHPDTKSVVGTIGHELWHCIHDIVFDHNQVMGCPDRQEAHAAIVDEVFQQMFEWAVCGKKKDEE